MFATRANRDNSALFSWKRFTIWPVECIIPNLGISCELLIVQWNLFKMLNIWILPHNTGNTTISCVYCTRNQTSKIVLLCSLHKTSDLQSFGYIFFRIVVSCTCRNDCRWVKWVISLNSLFCYIYDVQHKVFFFVEVS